MHTIQFGAVRSRERKIIRLSISKWWLGLISHHNAIHPFFSTCTSSFAPHVAHLLVCSFDWCVFFSTFFLFCRRASEIAVHSIAWVSHTIFMRPNQMNTEKKRIFFAGNNETNVNVRWNDYQSNGTKWNGRLKQNEMKWIKRRKKK